MVHGGKNSIMLYHLKPDRAQVKPIAIVMNTNNKGYVAMHTNLIHILVYKPALYFSALVE